MCFKTVSIRPTQRSRMRHLVEHNIRPTIDISLIGPMLIRDNEQRVESGIQFLTNEPIAF